MEIRIKQAMVKYKKMILILRVIKYLNIQTGVVLTKVQLEY